MHSIHDKILFLRTNGKKTKATITDKTSTEYRLTYLDENGDKKSNITQGYVVKPT